MLRKLLIRNYAIIDEIEIQFPKNLNVITGETGAGKSILMGALSLILGERADASVLQNAQKKCYVEGTFGIDNKKAVKDFLLKHELDLEEELVIRREIAANGKSRAFINDTPATLIQIKMLASLLVDLHQQFDTLELGDAGFQREVLDALADNKSVLENYQQQYKQLTHCDRELKDLFQQRDSSNKEIDYNRFLFEELDQLNLKENELEELDAELKLLSNSEEIKTTLSKVYFDLEESDQPIVQQLKVLSNQLQSLSAYHSSLPELTKRLLSAQIELQDIAGEIDQVNNKVNFDQKHVDQINEKISLGYKMLKKHGVTSTAELLEIKDQLEKKVHAVIQIDETISSKEIEHHQLLAKTELLAEELSTRRKKVIKPFEEKVNKLLVQVGMSNARIKVAIVNDSLNSLGKDTIEFLFDGNTPAGAAGNIDRFESLRKVASGGELSRLMLCIKSLVAQTMDLPTLIFDEIDSGISGEAARQVGIIMKGLSNGMQVICITHQPQIAGKANAHFFVYKEIRNDTIKTNIRLLSQDERITSIAKMLSGEKPTAAALENAREMVSN